MFACRILAPVPKPTDSPPSAPFVKWRAYVLALGVAWLAGGLIWVWHSAQGARRGEAKQNLQIAGAAKVYSQYGGSTSCRECHEEAYDDWKRSNHGLAERLPDRSRDDPAFVPARTFHHGTQQTTLLATNGTYRLITGGLHGGNETFIGERVFGNYPLRQMLVPQPGGRWQATEAAWDPRSNEWFNVYGTEDRKPGEWGNWLGRGMNWNSMCAICHNTRLRKNYDPDTDTYHTTTVESGVGCESCHGPLKAHNEWQRVNQGKNLKDPTLPAITRQQTFETCAGCHSRRADVTGDFVPGDSYWDHYLLTIADESDVFYPDGQIWDEDYEFTAFLGSRMHDAGVRCMNCHNSHTLKNRLPGNLLCLTCHAPGMTNAPTVNPVTHSHHRVFGYDSNGVFNATSVASYQPATVKETGGECVNCHMPQTFYMQRHRRHDHGFTSPDPLLTKQFGIPNACERCHADKGTDWNLDYVEKWYGTNMNRPARLRAQILARAKRGDETAREPLLEILAKEKSFYWQAVAAKMLSRWANEPAVTAALLGQLANTNALVRQMAVAALGPLAAEGRADITDAVQGRLRDSARSVRLEAARHLTATLDTNSPVGLEYLEFLRTISDQPLGQLQVGNFELQRGSPSNALAHFQTAVDWDAYSPGIRHDYAIVLSQLGHAAEAVQQLEAGVKLAPRDAELHFKLALALNETGEKARVISELEQAVQCDPQHARAWYNLGLARNEKGDQPGALAALERAEAAAPGDATIPYARATILTSLGKMEEAKTAAKRACEVNPNFPNAVRLLRQLEGN